MQKYNCERDVDFSLLFLSVYSVTSPTDFFLSFKEDWSQRQNSLIWDSRFDYNTKNQIPQHEDFADFQSQQMRNHYQQCISLGLGSSPIPFLKSAKYSLTAIFRQLLGF